MHLTQYRRYENGESELPMNIAINLANIYNVSLDYLAGISPIKKGLNESLLSPVETQLVLGFRQLKEVNQGRMLERLEILLKNGDSIKL